MKTRIKVMTTFSMVLMLIACGEDNKSGMSEPSSMVPTLSILVVDSIGVEMGDSNYVFGSIAGIDFAPDGNIVVLDNARSSINVYSDDGVFIRRFGNRGNGPGEFQSVAFLGISGSGRVFVIGEASGLLGVHTYDYFTGDWIGSIQTGNPPTCLEGSDGNSHVRVDNEYDISSGQPRFIFSVDKWDEAGDDPICVYQEYAVNFDPCNMGKMITIFWDAYDIVVGSDGRVYLAPYSTEEAKLYAFERNGTERFVIDLGYEPVSRTEDELEIEQNVLVMRAATMDMSAMGIEAEQFKPLITGLEVDREGNVWVQRGDRNTPSFDVFNSDGELIYQAVLEYDPTDGSTWQFTLGDSGLLAYAEDPSAGFQKVYILQTAEELTLAGETQQRVE